jgi:predicted nucleotidyltransferase
MIRAVTPTDETAIVTRFSGEPEVDVLALFGSAGSGRLGPDSDIDLYVRLRPTARWSLGKCLDLASEVSRICGREVDLIVEDDGTSVVLRREVASRGRALYESRPGAWTDLCAAAVTAYADLEPTMRRIGDAIRAGALRDGR